MAQLLLIKAESMSATDNRQAGDLVGIFEDDHIFSEHELKIFQVEKVPGTKREIEIAMVNPETGTAFLGANKKYTIITDLSTLSISAETKPVWKNGLDWQEIKVPPRFVLRDELGTIKENYSRFIENQTVLVKA